MPQGTRSIPRPHGCLRETGPPPTYLFMHLLEESDLLLQGLDASFQVYACQRGRVHILGGHRVRGNRGVNTPGRVGGTQGPHIGAGGCKAVPRAMPWCWGQAARGRWGREGRWVSHATWGGQVLTALKAARLFSASSFSCISSCSLGAERRGQGHPEGALSPGGNVPPRCLRAQRGPVERCQIVLHSRRAAGELAGGQGLFLPFPIIVNARESTKA